MLTDAEVIKGLAGLMEDHSWKVKAHAIRGEERERESGGKREREGKKSAYYYYY